MHISRGVLLSCLLGIAACDGQQAVSELADVADDGRVSIGSGQNAAVFGEYTVRVNALTTDQLLPEVARGYGITRSTARVLLNVSVSQGDSSAVQSTPAQLSVSVRNLSNQVKGIDMREAIVEDVIYYIGELGVSHGETLVFDIDVSPVGIDEPYRLRYRKQFFTE